MTESATEKIKSFFRQRSHAYRAVFTKSPLTEVVLKDLAKFCRAAETAYHPDPRIHAVLEGRREVWLRIQEHLKLTDDELWELRGKDLA